MPVVRHPMRILRSPLSQIGEKGQLLLPFLDREKREKRIGHLRVAVNLIMKARLKKVLLLASLS